MGLRLEHLLTDLFNQHSGPLTLGRRELQADPETPLDELHSQSRFVAQLLYLKVLETVDQARRLGLRWSCKMLQAGAQICLKL